MLSRRTHRFHNISNCKSQLSHLRHVFESDSQVCITSLRRILQWTLLQRCLQLDLLQRLLCSQLYSSNRQLWFVWVIDSVQCSRIQCLLLQHFLPLSVQLSRPWERKQHQRNPSCGFKLLTALLPSGFLFRAGSVGRRQAEE